MDNLALVWKYFIIMNGHVYSVSPLFLPTHTLGDVTFFYLRNCSGNNLLVFGVISSFSFHFKKDIRKYIFFLYCYCNCYFREIVFKVVVLNRASHPWYIFSQDTVLTFIDAGDWIIFCDYMLRRSTAQSGSKSLFLQGWFLSCSVYYSIYCLLLLLLLLSHFP